MAQVVPAKECIDKAVELIKAGELVVFPTETVYGLGANAFDASAVAKIFEAKGRPQDNPLIVHIADLSQVRDVAREIPSTFYALAERFMPGPLTVILFKSDKIPSIVTAGGDTVGIRMPDNIYAREVIAGSFPLAAPSANKSKHISPTLAEHVREDLGDSVRLIMDDGPCRVGIESTVLDLTTDMPTILRPGAVTANMLAEVLGEVSEQGKIIRVAKSPGMKYAHYCPNAETVTAQSIDSAVRAYDEAASAGRRPVIVARDIYRDKIGDRDQISLGITADDYARRIYAALHTAEKSFDYIIVEELAGADIAPSVMNRVFKAAGGKRV